MLVARPGAGRAGRGRECGVLVWVLGAALLWMAAAVLVAAVLGAVISRADHEDPAVDVARMRVPARPTLTPVCDCPLHSVA